jgi:Chaperone of endosialidase
MYCTNVRFVKTSKLLWSTYTVILALVLILPKPTKAQTDNTAYGTGALASDTSGPWNSAFGYDALHDNKTGTGNTAVGFLALFSGTGNNNTATGAKALYSSSSTAWWNTANGYGALYLNNSGSANTADGFKALLNNTTGGFNTALGAEAGYNLTTGSNNIDIGNQGVAGDNGTIKIGIQNLQTATYIAGIYGGTAADGIEVYVDSAGQLGTKSSSARFKEAIEPMDKTSEAILALQPVTFHYKKELDSRGIPQFGLVAEQVEKVDPDLVTRDENGRVYSVRYEAVNAMLLNEFLKEHQRVQELQKQVDVMAAQMKEQARLIQHVSDKLEINNVPRQLATNTK